MATPGASGSSSYSYATGTQDDGDDSQREQYPIMKLAFSLVAMAVPAAITWWWWQRREAQGVSLDDILASETRDGAVMSGGVSERGSSSRASGTRSSSSGGAEGAQSSADPLDAIRSAPWPQELPGMAKIIAYDDLKDALLNSVIEDANEDDDAALAKLPTEKKQQLRHALMDRCQAHVAWLLRLEREQRSMDRMSRKGMISASDYAVFSAFAEKLDAEVTEVRDEAAWLCGDEDDARGAQAADEIWRIAVQIWQQRRQQAVMMQQQQQQRRQFHRAGPRADDDDDDGGGESGDHAETLSAEELKKRAQDDARRAKLRAAQAKKSLKGLKGGFLSDTAKPTATTRDAADKTAAAGEKNNGKNNGALGKGTSKPGPAQQNGGATASSSKSSPAQEYRAPRWPDELPGVREKLAYEKLKAKTVREYRGPDAIPEGDAKQRLRNALMERCQAHVPFLSALEQEQRRMRDAVDKSRWRSGAGAPSADDVGRFDAASTLAHDERRAVESEAEWLGDRDGKPGMGARIWPTAFHVFRQMRASADEKDKAARTATAKALEAYEADRAKPWPASLPGARHRDEYDRLKTLVLQKLPAHAQASVLQHPTSNAARPAPQLVGPHASRSLRQALMMRAQQTVPLIQRLQAEGRAVKLAADRNLITNDEFTKFKSIEAALKTEVDAVKHEAEWLSDDANRKGMGDQIWPAAFQIYNKRRAEIAARLALAQKKEEEDQGGGGGGGVSPAGGSGADASSSSSSSKGRDGGGGGVVENKVEE